MTTPFVVYRLDSGQITRTGAAPDDESALAQALDGEAVLLNVTADDLLHRVVDQCVVSK